MVSVLPARLRFVQFWKRRMCLIDIFESGINIFESGDSISKNRLCNINIFVFSQLYRMRADTITCSQIGTTDGHSWLRLKRVS